MPTTHSLIRRPGHVFADEIVVGMRVIPPGRVRPVEIVWQLTPRGDVFEFATASGAAIRMHRSEQARVAP